MKLKDNFHRIIDYLRISVTDRCNLRCRYCMPEAGIPSMGHGSIMRYEEILRVARVAVGLGIRKIRVTGGEPLVRRGITEFMRQVIQLPGLRELTLTTNGVLLEEKAQELYDLGVRRINVSLDTLTREKFAHITRRDLLMTVMNGIQKASEVGFYPIKINVVAIRGFNDDEILDFARITEKHPLHVRFIEYMPIGDGMAWSADCSISAEEIRSVIQRYRPLEPVAHYNSDGPAQMFAFVGAAGRVGFISSLSNSFCNSCNRLRLTADGKLRNCLFSDEETDLLALLRSSATDEQVAEMLTRCIRSKPANHLIHTGRIRTCHRSMSSIGG
ncbi:MAG: GTP 3',8-cyclase MoaA [Deltaproteobacteria bacterium]|nr:GTP 3',8-cyclase MoaA [Deltaproteobacteria bacterium]MBW2305424.1 GTP 3',8-cyclase MoaA [Deltaproteobacteria bacterium]